MATNYGVIKWLTGMFPATLTDAVYFKGSDKTLQSAIDGGEFLTQENLREALESVIGGEAQKLVTYRGLFSVTAYRTADFKLTTTKGDYWIYKGNRMHNIDGSALWPNGVVYFNGDYFQTIYIKYQHDITPQPNYDVCIMGSGAGGIGAAYFLRNKGYRVALIESLDTLGGTHCHGVPLYIPTPTCPWFKEFARECYDLGIMEITPRFQSPLYGVGPGTNFDKAFRATQFGDEKGVLNGFRGNYLKIIDYKVSQKYFSDLKDSIDIFINTEITKVNSLDRTVYSVTGRNVITGKECEISSRYFIDASGNGLFPLDSNLQLDVDYFVGTDPADRFGETGTGMYPKGYSGDHHAINTVEPIIINAGMQYHPGYTSPPARKYRNFTDLASKANYTYKSDEDSGITFESHSYGSGMSGKNLIEKSYSWNLGDGYDRALALFKGKIAGILPLLAIREKYRVHAEKMIDASWLTRQLTSSNYVSDRITSMSSWYPDIHTKNQSYAPPSTVANGVPYDAMIPKAYTNLLVACKAAGFSHLTASDFRLIRTVVDMGYSAGAAIYQLLEAGVEGADVRTVDVAAVQGVIRIRETIEELEEHFYGPTVQSEVLESLD